jgi:hypothetical protein
MKKKIIYIIILLIVGVVSFFLGKYDTKKTNLELQNDVKITTDKMNKIQERNEELTKLIEKQDIILCFLDGFRLLVKYSLRNLNQRGRLYLTAITKDRVK